MRVHIKIAPDVHDSLLQQLPAGLASRTLMKAKLLRNFFKAPVEYEIECDEEVAKSLLMFAAKYCPEAVTGINFALRVALSKERQLPSRGLLRW